MPATPGRVSDGEPDIGQAPGDLAKLQAFVNTLDIELSTDELGTPVALDRWLLIAGLVEDAAGSAGDSPTGPSGPGELAQARELREALRGVLGSHVTHRPVRRDTTERHTAGRGITGSGITGPGAGPDPSEQAAARLGRITSAMQARIQSDAAGRVSLVPAGSGSHAGLTRLLLIAAEATTLGTWARLKVCSADDCRWAFYDRSPTRSGCWCSMQICGSRAKSRAYRSRAAQAG